MEIKFNNRFTKKELTAINNLGKPIKMKSKKITINKVVRGVPKIDSVQLQPFMTDAEWFASDRYKRMSAFSKECAKKYQAEMKGNL